MCAFGDYVARLFLAFRAMCPQPRNELCVSAIVKHPADQAMAASARSGANDAPMAGPSRKKRARDETEKDAKKPKVAQVFALDLL